MNDIKQINGDCDGHAAGTKPRDIFAIKCKFSKPAIVCERISEDIKKIIVDGSAQTQTLQW
jgi:hypothetical protein